jgi:hypothetical protein
MKLEGSFMTINFPGKVFAGSAKLNPDSRTPERLVNDFFLEEPVRASKKFSGTSYVSFQDFSKVQRVP